MIELSLFSTRIPHYSLSLFPFIALLAAVGLDWLVREWDDNNSQFQLNKKISDRLNPRSWRALFSYTFGTLGLLLVIASVVILFIDLGNIRQYTSTGLVLGLGWLSLPLILVIHSRRNYEFINSNYWIFAWLISAWLALAVAGSNGFLSNYNPDIKTLLEKPVIMQVLRDNTVNFIGVRGKMGVLVDFYTPNKGKYLSEISTLSPNSYTWISKELDSKLDQNYQVLGDINNHQLIKILSDPEK